MGTTTNYSMEYPEAFSEYYKNNWAPYLIALHVKWDSELTTRTADYNFNGFKLVSPNIKFAKEAIYNFTSDISGGAVTIDLVNGNYQYGTLPSDCEITFANFPSGAAGFITLEVTQDSTGGRALTFADTYRTPGSGALVPATTANAVNMYHVIRRASGAPYTILMNQNLGTPA